VLALIEIVCAYAALFGGTDGRLYLCHLDELFPATLATTPYPRPELFIPGFLPIDTTSPTAASSDDEAFTAHVPMPNSDVPGAVSGAPSATAASGMCAIDTDAPTAAIASCAAALVPWARRVSLARHLAAGHHRALLDLATALSAIAHAAGVHLRSADALLAAILPDAAPTNNAAPPSGAASAFPDASAEKAGAVDTPVVSIAGDVTADAAARHAVGWLIVAEFAARYLKREMGAVMRAAALKGRAGVFDAVQRFWEDGRPRHPAALRLSFPFHHPSCVVVDRCGVS